MEYVPPARDFEEIEVVTNQRWSASWHPPLLVPAGKRHGSAGLCFVDPGNVVIVTEDGATWGLPAWRPDADHESWEETLRREVQEEACAEVEAARLLGFSRSHCVERYEAGLVIVRAFWWCTVGLGPWEPQFEMVSRRIVPVSRLLAELSLSAGNDRIYLRALAEAGLPPGP